MKSLLKKEILGVGVTDASHQEILEYIFSSLQNDSKPYYIVTPNPEIVMLAKRDFSFRKVLNEAELSLCDGVGLHIASRVLGKPIKARVTGTDLVEYICKESVRLRKDEVRNPVSIGFLGARHGVALKAAECLREKYPGLNVVFIADEWGDDGFIKTNDLMSHQPSAISHQIDILFVAYGFPKQELWMAERVGKLPVKIMLGVGGAFDYISGRVSRAPRFVRAIGLEWLYRLIRQPWRVKRQRALIRFILLVLREKLKR